jgi:hypothetical protein
LVDLEHSNEPEGRLHGIQNEFSNALTNPKYLRTEHDIVNKFHKEYIFTCIVFLIK